MNRQHPVMLDMRWIFLDISPGLDPVVLEERKAPRCVRSTCV
jgi:hypothetical protein